MSSVAQARADELLVAWQDPYAEADMRVASKFETAQSAAISIEESPRLFGKHGFQTLRGSYPSTQLESL